MIWVDSIELVPRSNVPRLGSCELHDVDVLLSAIADQDAARFIVIGRPLAEAVKSVENVRLHQDERPLLHRVYEQRC